MCDLRQRHSPFASIPPLQTQAHNFPPRRWTTPRTLPPSCFFYSGGVNFLMQLQFLAPVELFVKQLNGYSF